MHAKTYSALQRRADTVLLKNIPLTLFERFRKGYERYYLREVSWRLNRTASYYPPNSSGYSSISFPFSWAAQPRTPPTAGTWFSFQHLSLTDLNFLSPRLYNNLTFTYFLRASQFALSQGCPLISSTGCTCYLLSAFLLLTAWPGSICYREKTLF